MNHLDRFLEMDPDGGYDGTDGAIRRHTPGAPTPVVGAARPDAAERRRQERLRRAPETIVGQLLAYFSAPWRDEAACKGKPTEWWLPSKSSVGHDYTDPRARALCESCPVKEPCREFAVMNSERGYWGATSERQRRIARQSKEAM